MTEGHERRIVEHCLWIYALLVVSLTALAWGVYLGEGRAELKRPLFDSSDRFRDLTNYAGKIAHLSDGAAALSRGLPTYNYPAPAAYVYAFLLRGFPHHPVRAYLAILVAGLVCGAFLLWKGAQTGQKTSWGLIAAILVTATLGFPMVFAADRANLEGIVGLVLGTGLVLFVTKRYYGSAIVVGLAASIKPFPGLFLLLLLKKKLYRQVGVGITAAACSTLLALTVLGPTPLAAYEGLQPGVSRYLNDYVLSVPFRGAGRFQHSIMDGLKSVATESVYAWEGSNLRRSRGRKLSAPPAEPPITHASTAVAPGAMIRSHHYAQLRTMFLVSMLLGAIGFAFVLVRFFKLPVVNQMILLAVAITLFPPVSAEYTLVHLYVPFGLFVIFLTKDVGTGCVELKQRSILTLLSLFALLFSPLTFVGRFSGDLKMLLLVTLLITVASYPMPSSIFGEVEARLAEGSA